MKINFLNLTKALSILIYTLFIFYTLLSDNITSYVHPRFEPFIFISCIISFLISISLFKNIFFETHENFSKPRIIFLIIPLLFALINGKTQNVYTDDLQISNNLNKTNQIDDEEYHDPYVEEIRKLEKLVLNENQFIAITQDITDNPLIYKGRQIELTGITLKRKGSTDKNEFAIARMMMTCCAIDTQPVGFICYYHGAENLKQSSWYHVKGKIDVIKLDNLDTSVIIVDSVETANKPKDEYVYPF